MRERLRPLLAALLAVTIPGLGHVLLRRWGRALVWHGTIVGGTIALYLLYDVEPVDPLAGPSAVAAAVPVEVTVAVTFLIGLSAVDAYLLGREDAARAARTEAAATMARTPGPETDGAADAPDDPARPEPDENAEPAAIECPNCGRETDAEIDFCHWCTEPLPWADGGGEEA